MLTPTEVSWICSTSVALCSPLDRCNAQEAMAKLWAVSVQESTYSPLLARRRLFLNVSCCPLGYFLVILALVPRTLIFMATRSHTMG